MLVNRIASRNFRFKYLGKPNLKYPLDSFTSRSPLRFEESNIILRRVGGKRYEVKCHGERLTFGIEIFYIDFVPKYQLYQCSPKT